MKNATSLRPLGKLMMVSAITAGLLLAGSGVSWADRDGRHGGRDYRYEQRDDHRKGDRYDRGYHYRDGYRGRNVTVVKTLPRGYRTVVVNRTPYYVHDHHYYSRGPSGYVVVPPPVGAIFASLPIGSVRVTLGTSFFYRSDNVYFRPAPSGYVVIAPPAAYPFRQAGWW